MAKTVEESTKFRVQGKVLDGSAVLCGDVMLFFHCLYGNSHIICQAYFQPFFSLKCLIIIISAFCLLEAISLLISDAIYNVLLDFLNFHVGYSQRFI